MYIVVSPHRWSVILETPDEVGGVHERMNFCKFSYLTSWYTSLVVLNWFPTGSGPGLGILWHDMACYACLNALKSINYHGSRLLPTRHQVVSSLNRLLGV